MCNYPAVDGLQPFTYFYRNRCVYIMSVTNTHFGAAGTEKLLKNCRSVFFIGIGGINMSSLALITHRRGYKVGGSDRTLTLLTDKLAAGGIEIFEGHSAENLDGYDAVIYTVAITDDNPEYVRAKETGIPLISRADYLGYIMTGYPVRVGVCGMHGKSTCTAMLSQIFIGCDRSPTVMCGAGVPVMDGAYYLGHGEDFIFEACEYMDSFLDFYPNIAVILNIEPEHLDYFKNIDHIRSSFAKFAGLCGKDGLNVLNADDDEVMKVAGSSDVSKLTFGIKNKADIMAVNIDNQNGFCSFDVIAGQRLLCHVRLSVCGEFNIYNALAALAVAHYRGIDCGAAARELEKFRGAERRMEHMGKFRGADVYSDYAHHPTEIAATLKGAKQMTHGRLFCVFQPHTYSRVYAFLDEMCRALSTADRTLMIYIYPARETDTKGMSSALIAERIGDSASYCENYGRALDILKNELSDGDMLIVMGAGSIVSFFDVLVPLDNK